MNCGVLAAYHAHPGIEGIEQYRYLLSLPGLPGLFGLYALLGCALRLDSNAAVEHQDAGEQSDEACASHEELGCIVFINEAMSICFIADPDGCYLELLPER